VIIPADFGNNQPRIVERCNFRHDLLAVEGLQMNAVNLRRRIDLLQLFKQRQDRVMP